MSASYQSATVAARDVGEQVHVLDTATAAGGQALVVLSAAGVAGTDATTRRGHGRGRLGADAGPPARHGPAPRTPRAERTRPGDRGLGRPRARHQPAVRVPRRARQATAPGDRVGRRDRPDGRTVPALTGRRPRAPTSPRCTRSRPTPPAALLRKSRRRVRRRRRVRERVRAGDGGPHRARAPRARVVVGTASNGPRGLSVRFAPTILCDVRSPGGAARARRSRRAGDDGSPTSTSCGRGASTRIRCASTATTRWPSSAAEFGDLEAGTETDTAVRVAGRILLIRRQGKLTFATMRDQSGTVQLFVSNEAHRRRRHTSSSTSSTSATGSGSRAR